MLNKYTYAPTIVSVAILVYLALFAFFKGSAVPPDQLALTINYLGDREIADAKSGNAVANKNTYQLLGKPVDAAVRVGERVPKDIPGVRRTYRFPMGTTSLSFTDSTIPESPADNGFKLPVNGGQIAVDTVFNMQIMSDSNDITPRLVRLLNGYQVLSSYSGEPSKILQALAQGIFRQELRQAFVRQTQGRSIRWVANHKTDINEEARKFLNTKFNPFGIQFTLAAISSDVDLAPAEQQKMNKLVVLAATNVVQKKRNEDYLPKLKEKVRIKEEGRTAASKIRDAAEIEAAGIVAAAETRQHAMLSKLFGKSEAGELKNLLTLLGNEPQEPITVIATDTRVVIDGQRQTLVSKIGEK